MLAPVILLSEELGENNAMARGLYGLTVAWWKGAFTPESAASAMANMLDKDYACEIWKIDHRSSYTTYLKSESLGASVSYSTRFCKCAIYLRKKDDWSEMLTPEVSAYDDYLLANACERWIKRSQEIRDRKKESESQRLINKRITEGYIKTVEMVEKKILGREPETANELRALTTEPPEQPTEKPKAKGTCHDIQTYVTNGTDTTQYFYTTGVQQGTAGSGPTKSKSRSSRGD